jgi:hypothetical protein
MLDIKDECLDEAVTNVLEFVLAESRLVSFNHYQNIAINIMGCLFIRMSVSYFDEEDSLKALELFYLNAKKNIEEYLDGRK